MQFYKWFNKKLWFNWKILLIKFFFQLFLLHIYVRCTQWVLTLRIFLLCTWNDQKYYAKSIETRNTGVGKEFSSLFTSSSNIKKFYAKLKSFMLENSSNEWVENVLKRAGWTGRKKREEFNHFYALRSHVVMRIEENILFLGLRDW